MEFADSVYEKALPYDPSRQKPPEVVSEADYWQFYYDYPDESYEWNNGHLEKKNMGDKLSYLLSEWFYKLLNEYLTVFPEGESIGREIGFALNLGHKKTIRKPDLAIIHQNNTTQFELKDRSYKGICDLCIEFLSDSSRDEVERDTLVKKEEYAQAGVREYFILDRLHNETAFYRLEASNNNSLLNVYQPILPTQEGVIHSQVLSHFAFRLEHLRILPDLKSLINDPVYQPFVLKSFQEERQAKEQERQAKEEALEKAKQERQAKEQERQAKEEALEKAKQERQAKEQERQAKEQERQAKEEALERAEKEQQAKEAALEKVEQERQAREAIEMELQQLRAQIHKDEI